MSLCPRRCGREDGKEQSESGHLTEDSILQDNLPQHAELSAGRAVQCEAPGNK